jgi:hypothetical protein
MLKTIDWFERPDDWVVKYSENGRVSPPDPPLLPDGGPEYILAHARFNGKVRSMPVDERFNSRVRSMPVGEQRPVKHTVSQEENPSKDPKLVGGFRRKKRKRTRRKHVSKKSHKKNKKTFRR